MTEITRQLDRLRIAKQELEAQRRGISPKVSTYANLTAEIEAIDRRIEELVEKRGSIRVFKADEKQKPSKVSRKIEQRRKLVIRHA